jgi:PAS domain S-box-containing protein
MSFSDSSKPTALAGDVPVEAYKLLVESIRDYAIFMLDPTGHVMTWTAAARAMKGYEAAEIIGAHFSTFYPKEQIERRWPEHELAQATAIGRFEDENWRIRKDGTRFWANVVITALRDETGKLFGFAKITRDLSERRAQEEALRQSEERFRLLVEGVREYAIFSLDTDGFVTSWNAGAEKLKGYTAEEIIGAHFSRFYPPEALKHAWPEHELRMATMDGRFEDEGWRIRKDGSRFWASVVITALRDAQGTLKGFSKITRDLTERKEAERRLAESEQLFRTLVQGVTDYAIIMLDHGGVVSSWNGGAEAITGYSTDEILGKHFSHFYTSEDIRASKPWQQLLAASETGRSADESWRVKKDSSQFWSSSVISAIYDAERKHRGYVLVMQDLTARRHAETLADTTQRMHEFIAMLAHELRNPLAPIRNAVELMRNRGLADPTLEAMRATIDRQLSTMTRLIDDLLDVNRIARGHFSVGRESVDLREVVSRAVEATNPLIAAYGHRLSVAIPDSMIVIQGDPIRLTQVFVNLLNNAAKYTPTGGSIGITLDYRETDVVVRVTDSGRGIEPSDLERIFDLFTQLEPNPAGQGGLGVGLALVRRVVELHGGTVRARSAGLGQGSEFTVTLPRPVERLELVSATKSENGKKAVARMRVLVVDDNRDAAESLQLLLTALGQDAYAVFDGKTAIEAAHRLRPHIVLLDIGMPGMSGYEVADALRASFGKDVPVLAAITGWGQETDKRVAQARGFNYHFTKPVNTAVLQDLLAAVAESHANRGEPRA